MASILDPIARLDDLANNPSTRVPIGLCLDTSGSMNGSAIGELNAGISLLYDELKRDERAACAAEIAVVTFGFGGARVVREFSSLELQPDPPRLQADGPTPMGEAVRITLDLVEGRKKQYRSTGVDYFQPWLILMTDGQPNGDIQVLMDSVSRIYDLVQHKKLSVFAVGVGHDADMDVLGRFSPGRPPLRMQGLHFRELFQWLSRSVSKTSRSMPGDENAMSADTAQSWNDLQKNVQSRML